MSETTGPVDSGTDWWVPRVLSEALKWHFRVSELTLSVRRDTFRVYDTLECLIVGGYDE